MEEDKQKALRNIIREKSSNGRLECETAHQIQAEYNFSLAEIGRTANELGIKIIACQLGCF